VNTYLVTHFRHNGYLVLPRRLSADRVDRLKQTILHDVQKFVEPVVRDEDRVTRISQILDRNPVFLETARCREVIEPLKVLLGPNILVLKNRHNHATLNYRTHKRDNFHRDNVQWSRGLLTVIFYLEDTTLENGCTQVVPGSHLLQGVEHLHNLSNTDWICESGLLQQRVPIPVEAGQMLAIDSTIFHRAGPNWTEGSRMSMTIGYQSVDELWDGDNPTRLLVAGERIYMGNDRSRG
jgi:phytanoyl-CoA hydroxylase